MRTDLKKFLQRNRVFAGFIAAAAYFLLARPSFYALAIGLPIAAVGLAIRAWACGHLRKSDELDTSGPYAYTRNPLYLGTFVITAGFGVASGIWWLFALMCVFILSIYLPVMNVERDALEAKFGGEYTEFAEGVPLLVPRLTPWKKSERGFDFQLYLKNGEYQAGIGFVVAALVLVAKAMLLGE